MSLPKGYRTTCDDSTSAPPADKPNSRTEELEVVWDGNLAGLLDELAVFFRRYVVVGAYRSATVALWIAHSYIFEAARATPYIHFVSPEPGSGKTTALDVLEVLAARAIAIDNISGPALFRLIEADRPSVLLDEVDGVFAKKRSDDAEDHRTLLNSGYRKGKQAIRCGGKNRDELKRFNLFCPKALAGLRELPTTLAHRTIPIDMKPPRPDEAHADFDVEEVEQEAGLLRARLRAWAEVAEGDLRDPRLKPPKLPELDARGNEIWRVLFRIADLGGGHWPETARAAARELSSGRRREDEASLGIQLLIDIKHVFIEDKITCPDLAAALNALEASPWGGWNDGKGISTRELGVKLKRYDIRAKSIRIGGKRAGNGYEKVQFEDAWSRYLRNPDFTTGTTSTTGSQSQKSPLSQPVQTASVPVMESGANPHEQRDVPVVPVMDAENGTEAGFVRDLIDTFDAVEIDPETEKCITCTARVPADVEQCEVCVEFLSESEAPAA